MKKTKALVVAKSKKIAVIQDNSPASMIRAAAEGKLDLDKLEKFLNMQKEFEATQAEKLFNSAFTKAQAEIEGVVKTKDNPHTKSKYADLGAVIESAKPVYTKHGFAIIFYEGDAKATDNVRVCADVLHESGHKETYHYDIPLDGVGIQGNAMMTKIHGKSSSVAYGRRYLMCMIWNIPTLDNDGNGSQKPVVAKPEPKPAVVIPQVKVTIGKGLSEMAKKGFEKARKALGEEEFMSMVGAQGYSKVEEITNEGVALQMIRDMEAAFKAKNA
jgi:hypothetical protein